MNVLLFGATGMIGQGVLQACIDDPRIVRVVTVARRPLGRSHPKLEEILHEDFTDYTAIADRLQGFGACFFCLGVSSVGMNEADYTRITHDFTLAAARSLVERNPNMVFTYVTGVGTDSTEKGSVMWARVKGRTENELLAMPFKAAYMFRPGVINPGPGVVAERPVYKVGFVLLRVLFPIAKAIAPDSLTTTDTIGRAMIAAAFEGGPSRVLLPKHINALGR